jgi:hypothetical protein
LIQRLGNPLPRALRAYIGPGKADRIREKEPDKFNRKTSVEKRTAIQLMSLAGSAKKTYLCSAVCATGIERISQQRCTNSCSKPDLFTERLPKANSLDARRGL